MLPGQLDLPHMVKLTTMPPADSIRRDARVDGHCRYTLTRYWRAGDHVCFIGLNPSTADATRDDPTVRKWMSFAYRWGYAGMVAVNLFPFRSKSPKLAQKSAEWEKNGPDWYARDRMIYNRGVVAAEAKRAALVVACWGAANWDLDYAEDVIEGIVTEEEPWPDIYVLGLTKFGIPIHPMARGRNFVPGDAKPVLWREGTREHAA